MNTASPAAKLPLRWAARRVKPPSDLSAMRCALSSRSYPAMLESVAFDPSDGRFSIYACEPVRVVTIHDETIDPFARLAQVCRPWQTLERPGPWPFVGGWIGYLSYEAGRFVEPSAAWRNRDLPLPAAQWAFYDTVLIHDRLGDEWHVAGIESKAHAGVGRTPLDQRLGAWERWLDSIAPGAGNSCDGGSPTAAAGNWNLSESQYECCVNRALDYIRAGDVFQVNLARRLRAPLTEHPIHLYERLRCANPACYAAYLEAPGIDPHASLPAAIVSSSPELFLRLTGREVITRPIKGTARRCGDPAVDEPARRALAASAKDLAELNMIIDLERNDLGRVCEYGSVRVLDPGSVETLPTVFHRTATIAGRLRGDADALDLVRAVFPGGSITGAPKVRAMQIIQELEPDGRGAYCGAIGCIGVDGDLVLNLAIRTMTAARGRVDLHVGSGIVADSDPRSEARELHAKAAGMLRALYARPSESSRSGGCSGSGLPVEEAPQLAHA